MRIIFKEDSMLNPFLSFFPEAVLYSKPKTQSNNNPSSIAFMGDAVSYTIVEDPFFFVDWPADLLVSDSQDI